MLLEKGERILEEIYKEIWEEICFDIKDHEHDEEAKFQIVAENIFGKLGWSKRLGEITKPHIPVGSSNIIIPDIVIKKEGENLFVVELKRIDIDSTQKNVDQLKSYMRQLRLKFGLLIGKSIQVFYESSEKKDIVRVCGADFEDENVLGPQIIMFLSKKEYNEERFEEFCKEIIKGWTEEEEIRKKVKFLCSADGKEYIKELLRIEYIDEVINRLEITVLDINSPPPPKIETIEDYDPFLDLKVPKEFRRIEGESIQKWIKRILSKLYDDGEISLNEISNLHSLEYSKKTFGIEYSLICDHEKETRDRTGHSRYWRNWKLKDKYYVCSEWWKDKERKYHENINAWIKHLLKIT